MLSRQHFLHTPPVRLSFAAPKPAPAAPEDVGPANRERLQETPGTAAGGATPQQANAPAAAAPTPPRAGSPQANPAARPPRTPPADDDDLLPRAPRASERPHWRDACDCLELFRICRMARCRRTGRCCGDPVACLRSGLRQAPESMRELVRCLLQAQDEGLSLADAFEDAADHHDCYFAWIAGLSAGCSRP